jgi:acid phosphatase type 7
MKSLNTTTLAIAAVIGLSLFCNLPLWSQDAAIVPVEGQVPEVSRTDLAAPSIMPDRVVLTWHGDPTTSQAVTWRTSIAVKKAFAELAVADHGPKFQRFAVRFPATTETLTTDLNTANFHSVRFEGLDPAKRYAYRVGDGTNWSEWFQFSTASTTAEPFSFIYFGDAQNDLKSMWSRVIREAHREAPKARFMIHAGDLINRAESDSDWNEWFQSGSWLNAMVPSVPAPGNHEMAKVDETTRRLTHHWRPQFTLPENGVKGIEETNYTFVYQGVRIVVMNSMEKLEEQAAWLDDLLSKNQERWVICSFHYPIFSTGKTRDNENLRKLWKPILDKHKVDLVLQGHDHTYGRTGLETPIATANLKTGVNASEMTSGTVYVVSVSGPKMYDVQKYPFMKRVAEDTQLFQIIHINNDKLQYEAYTAAGVLYDAFTLTKQPGMINELTDQAPSTPERLRPPVVAEEKKASEALPPEKTAAP